MEFPVVNGVKVFTQPPEGYVVDFDNPRQQKVVEHYAIFGVFGTLAFIALCQRYYTKIWLSKGLQVDDCECALLLIESGKPAHIVSLYVLGMGHVDSDAGTPDR